jgi:hypothetical protein
VAFSVRACAVAGLLSCAGTSIEDPILEASATDGGPIDTTGDDDAPTAATDGRPPDVGSAADESGDAPPDGWFAATTRVIFYEDQYAQIGAHSLAITEQLSSASGLIDYSFDFDLQSGRAQSISLWESEFAFWMFVGSAAHARAMVELTNSVAGRDFSYATWWVENETLPSRDEADAHLGPEPTPGPHPVE